MNIVETVNTNTEVRTIEKKDYYSLKQVSEFYNRSSSCITYAMKELGIEKMQVKDGKTNRVQNGISHKDLTKILDNREWGFQAIQADEITLTEAAELFWEEAKESDEPKENAPMRRRVKVSGVEVFKRDAGQKAQECIKREHLDLLRKVTPQEYPIV